MSPCFQLDLIMIIIVENLNDNPPVFDQNTYRVNVNEVRNTFKYTGIIVKT